MMQQKAQITNQQLRKAQLQVFYWVAGVRLVEWVVNNRKQGEREVLFTRLGERRQQALMLC